MGMQGFPPKRIVVAVDLSAPSLAALDAAKALARRWGSSLELVRVQAPVLTAAALGPEGVPIPLPEPDPDHERRLERRLLDAASGFPRERVTIRTLHGWPVRAMVERAAAGAGLVVMGTHGYAGFDRALLGSVAETVVRSSRVPVLTVRESRTPLTMSRILAPWNGRPYATRALRYARAAAKGLGAELRVLRVVPAGESIEKAAPGLGRTLESLLGPGGPGRWSLRVRVGDARESIVREANSGRYGLIVLSAHRRPFSSDIVLGSTVERTLRHARIPVLSIPSGRPSGL